MRRFRLSTFGERQKGGQIGSPRFGKVLPEPRLEKRDLTIETGDRFDVDRHSWTENLKAVEVLLPIDDPLAHCRPLYSRTVRRLPDHRIAQTGRHGVRAEQFK